MYFQEIIMELERYWASRDCVIAHPYDVEKGAGTMSPHTFFRALGPEPWRVGYVEPSRRPADGRYGENPNRLYQHHQYQVILKPSPEDVQDQYLGSLQALGFDAREHDIRFVEDNWEAPTLGAWGLGWEVWLDGMEITQFTYFQQIGGFECRPVSVELTYGLERIAAYVQGVDNVFDVMYAPGVRYGDVWKQAEFEQSKYAFEVSDAPMLFTLFNTYEQEAGRVLDEGLVLAAYDYVLKCSHAFNLLDARGVISVSERAGFIGRVRHLARACAAAWLEQRAAMGHPLLQDVAARPRWEATAAVGSARSDEGSEA